LTLEGDGSTFLWNVKNKTSNDTVWHHRRPETSHTQHHIHFGTKHMPYFSDLSEQRTVLLATPLHLVHVQAVQIVVPCVTAATTKHKNLQHTTFSVPATLSLLHPPVYHTHKQTHPTFKWMPSRVTSFSQHHHDISHLDIYPARSLAAVMH
jgi:hypothetical protein